MRAVVEFDPQQRSAIRLLHEQEVDMLRVDSVLGALAVATLKAFLDAEDIRQSDFRRNRGAVEVERFQYSRERALRRGEERLLEIVDIGLRRSFAGAGFGFEQRRRDHEYDENDSGYEDEIHGSE